jgi:hypothetical protein
MQPEYQTPFIAPNTAGAKQRKPLGMIIALIVGVLVLVGVGLFFVFGNQGDSIDTQKQHLTARMTTLEALLEKGSASVANPDLRKVQADASLLIVGANTTLRDALPVKNVDKTITKSEADDVTFTELNDAKLNGSFDRPYQKALATKLESTMALLKEIYSKSTSKTVKDAATKSYDTYNNVLSALSAVSL